MFKEATKKKKEKGLNSVDMEQVIITTLYLHDKIKVFHLSLFNTVYFAFLFCYNLPFIGLKI